MLSFMAGCVDPYEPHFSEGIPTLLIVDGFINSSNQSASVRLTRSVALSDSNVPAPDNNASVVMEEQGGTQRTLSNQGSGNYASQGLKLNPSGKYRLVITTFQGKRYTSDFIDLQVATPPIDSLQWKTVDGGVNIYLDSHDPSGMNRYYRWNFVETWHYTSSYDSEIKLADGQVVARDINDHIYNCWKSTSSTVILIRSTVRLSTAIINDFLITIIPKESIKLKKRYSILVNQYSISEEACNYWQQLQKTTENLGGLFDPLPSQVKGNLHSESDPKETVLGYFSGGAVTSKRIFISINDLPVEFRAPGHTEECIEFSIPKKDVALLNGVAYLLIRPLDPPFNSYTYSFKDCVDCREKGGTNIKPDFW